MGFGFGLYSHGVQPESLRWTLLALATMVAAVLAQLAIWISHWGTRHQWVSAIATFGLFVVPWSTMLAPLLAGGGRGVSLFITLVQALALCLSAVFHAKQTRPDQQARRLTWSDCDIDLRKQVIRHADRPASPTGLVIAPALIGGLSVSLYQVLKSRLGQDSMLLLGVVVASGMGLWLCIWPLGRALGQAWQLSQLERELGGRFVSDRLPWLTQERRRSVVGRWWARQLTDNSSPPQR
jgi:hypothetical protein